MTQLNLINSKTTSGYKKQYKKWVSRGNLNWIYQRLDIGLLEGDKEYPDRVYLKVGKVKTPDAEFRNDKEQAQGWYETSPDIVKQLRLSLLSFEIKLRKKQGIFNYEYNRNEEIKDVVRVYKESMV